MRWTLRLVKARVLAGVHCFNNHQRKQGSHEQSVLEQRL